jgi:DNA repair protein RadD
MSAAGVLALVLRAYQVEAVAAIRAAFTQCRRVLFVLPTGGGKTVIFAYITEHAAAKGNSVIAVAHRQEIADQISAALTAMGVAHGRIQPGHTMTDDPVQVGMVRTIARRLDTIAAPALLVIDECHHAVAGTWTRLTAAWPNAKVLGTSSARPRCPRTDRRRLPGTVPVSRTQRRRRSLAGSQHRRRLQCRDLEDALDQDGITGNVVEHFQQHLAGRTAIAFCVTVAHAEHVALRFRDAGISAASIDGTMSSDQRHDLVNQLRTGELRVLASCEIISEGFDAPAVGGAILLRPTQSFALFRQQWDAACIRRATGRRLSSSTTLATCCATVCRMHRTNGRSTRRSDPKLNARRRPSGVVSARLTARCSRLVPTEKTVRCRMIRTACSNPESCPSARACCRSSPQACRRLGHAGSTSKTRPAGSVRGRPHR